MIQNHHVAVAIVIVIFCLVSACSRSIEGLWVEENDHFLMRVKDDSLILVNLQVGIPPDTLSYKLNADSLVCTGFDYNSAKSWRKAFKVKISPDTLAIDFKKDTSFFLIRSKHDSFFRYYLTQHDSEIRLPKAHSVREPARKYVPIDLFCRINEERIFLSVGKRQIQLFELEKMLTADLGRDRGSQNEYIARLFFDERVPMEVTFHVFLVLRKLGISNVMIAVENQETNPNANRFKGVLLRLPT